MKIAQRIAPCLWFDGEGEQAADYYISIFPNSKIVKASRFGETGREITGGEPGAVLTVAFELDGQSFTGSERAMAALLQMKKLDLAALQRAYSG